MATVALMGRIAYSRRLVAAAGCSPTSSVMPKKREGNAYLMAAGTVRPRDIHQCAHRVDGRCSRVDAAGTVELTWYTPTVFSATRYDPLPTPPRPYTYTPQPDSLMRRLVAGRTCERSAMERILADARRGHAAQRTADLVARYARQATATTQTNNLTRSRWTSRWSLLPATTRNLLTLYDLASDRLVW